MTSSNDVTGQSFSGVLGEKLGSDPQANREDLDLEAFRANLVKEVVETVIERALKEVYPECFML